MVAGRSEGLTYGCNLFLGSRQKNTVASYGGFTTAFVIPHKAFTGTGDFSTSGSITSDVAIQLTSYYPVINPGQTKIFNFVYGANFDEIEDALRLTTDEIALQQEAELNNINFDPVISVSPNPSSGNINIYADRVNSAASLELQITNLLGEIVYIESLENVNGVISTNLQLAEGLSNGAYLMNLLIDGKAYSKSFILNR